jgi:hypothetical protein
MSGVPGFGRVMRLFIVAMSDVRGREDVGNAPILNQPTGEYITKMKYN